MAAHPAFQTMLQGQIVALEAHRRAQTAVEYVSDPEHRGRTAVTISGPSKAGVQAEITRCMEAAENMGNSAATFLNPTMQRDGSWRSIGEVIIAPVVVG